MNFCEREPSRDEETASVQSDRSGSEAMPLLRIPTADAPEGEWLSLIPLDDLPPLPERGQGYCLEPITGVCMVLLICVGLISVTVGSAVTLMKEKRFMAWMLIGLISTFASLALSSMAFILLAGAGEVRRTPKTCYPIPEEVALRLLRNEELDGLRNIPGKAEGSTYCIRCLVWRQKTRRGGSTHHCNTCQRCVTGFDHHCGVFGRCIVNGNMKCFIILITMFALGVMTTGVALIGCGDDEPTYVVNGPKTPYYESNFGSTLPPLLGFGTTLSPTLLL